jgi:hypothetical protein
LGYEFKEGDIYKLKHVIVLVSVALTVRLVVANDNEFYTGAALQLKSTRPECSGVGLDHL